MNAEIRKMKNKSTFAITELSLTQLSTIIDACKNQGLKKDQVAIKLYNSLSKQMDELSI